MYNYKNIIFGMILNSVIFCAQFSKKGVLTLGSIAGNDAPQQWSKYQSNISYIPTISFKQNILTQSFFDLEWGCLLYTSPSPRDGSISRMPSSA